MANELLNNNHNNTNTAQVLDHAQHVQSKTRDALLRIQEHAVESELLGNETLEQLQAQRQQLDAIQSEGGKLNARLRQTSKLQNRMDRWAGHWRGAHKRQAKKEAQWERKCGKENTSVCKDKHGTVASAVVVHGAMTTRGASSKKQHMLHNSTAANNKKKEEEEDAQEQEELSEQDRAALCRVEENDEEIDGMLESAGLILDRLDQLAVSIKEETQTHSEQISNVDETLDKAHGKQVVINKRLKRMLGIHK